MRSLTAHLREPEAHDRLPFHPSCPICRQTRLSGTLATGGLISQRTQALLAAGLLASSATAPVAPAFAAEQDQQHDGVAAVEPSRSSDSAGTPDFDPGGEATDLPAEAPPLPQAQAPVDEGTDDSAPMDQPTSTDPHDPIVDPGDGTDGAPPPPTAAPSTTAPTAPAPAPPPAPVPPPEAAPQSPTDTTQPQSLPTHAPAAAAPTAAPRASGERTRRARFGRRPPAPITPSTAARRVTPAAAPDRAPAATPAAPAPTAGAVTDGPRARPGDRAHTVLAGESLWSIANDVLGADSTPAQIAREVHRLWRLNSDRIGTGDPDLLPLGTRLALR